MKKIMMLIGAGVIFASCQKEQVVKSSTTNVSPGTTELPADPCGEAEVHTLYAGQTIDAGTITILNDEQNVYVQYNTTGGWVITKTHLYVGDCDLIPTSGGGNPQIGLFPYQTTHSPAVNSFAYSIPLSSLTDCYCVAAHCEVSLIDQNGNIVQTQTGWASGDPFGGKSWAMKFNYCTQECIEDCSIEPGDFRTQTIGGWGAVPNGSNSGTYLHANFSAAFPNGLTVGCAGGNNLLFTNAQHVTDLLPSCGPNSVLTQSSVDPVAINSTFGSQIIALALSIGFDNYDSNFGASTNNLEDLVIGTGPFAGWTVGQLFNEANLVYGGCPSSFSAAELNSAISNLNSVLTSINQNFDDGNQNNGYLICP